MAFYELALLGIPLRDHEEASSAIAASLPRAGSGRMLGCWASDVGRLNEVAILREFDDEADLIGDRRQRMADASPFGCGSFLTSISLEMYIPFLDDLPAIDAGAHGPLYEIRTYELRLGGVARLQEAWSRKLPARSQLSPVAVAMTALDGRPRFTHIWPYASFEERARIREEATRQGIWPPNAFPGSPPTPMLNGIYRPLASSPLQ